MKKKFLLLVVFILFPIYCLACPFCDEKVLEGKVKETNTAFLLYNHKPSAEGHLMAIPKRHIESFTEITNVELAEIRDLVHSASIALKDLYNVDNYIIVQKNGANTGRSIAHIHFHILPIRDSYLKVVDKTFEITSKRYKLSKNKLDLINFKLKKYFNHQLEDKLKKA